MSFNDVLGVTGVVTEAILIGLLVLRGVGQKLPVFLVYCCWALMSDLSALGMNILSPGGYGMRFYIAITVIDFALQLCVLVELAWSVVRPLRSNISLKALPLIAAAVVAGGAAIWPFAGLGGVEGASPGWHFLMQMQQTASIMRVLFFLLLAVSSHMLSLGWRDRELQVATGFGFYSLVSLAVALMNTHHATEERFAHLYWAVAISFVFSLFYWVGSFAQKEAERHEFTPQMRHTLLALAEAVRVTRTELARETGVGD
jgi:hypothetical protein